MCGAGTLVARPPWTEIGRYGNAMSRKRTREELISNGFCPHCSKCVKQVDGFEGYVLYACERCGFFSMDASREGNDGALVEISLDQWQRFRTKYEARLHQAESEARNALPELLELVLVGRAAKSKHAVN